MGREKDMKTAEQRISLLRLSHIYGHSPIFFSWLTGQNRRTDAARCTIQPISADCFPVILQHGAFPAKQTV